MKTKINHIILCGIAIVTMILSGCTKTDEPCDTCGQNDEMVTVQFTMGDDEPIVVSRATNESTLANIQLLLIGPGGRYYYKPGSSKTQKVTIKKGVYDIYATGNYTGSIENLTAAQLNSLYAGFVTGNSTIPMGYKATADLSTVTTYSAPLKRIAAKIQFSVTSNTVKITSWQICHAPQGAAIIPGGSAAVSYGDITETSFNNSSGSQKSFSFSAYVPENLAGVNSAITDQKQRTRANAPANATYLKLEGDSYLYGVTTHIEYWIYLGGNETTDFNIRRNHNYQVNINIINASTVDLRILTYTVSSGGVNYMTPGQMYMVTGGSFTRTLNFKTNYPDVFPTVEYKFVFSGIPAGLMYINGQQAVGNVFSGTLNANTSLNIDPDYQAPYFTLANNKMSYTLTFTDTYGNVTTYTDNFTFANRVITRCTKTPGLGELGYVAFPNGGNRNEVVGEGGWKRVDVWYVGGPAILVATPNSGRSFKGWYRDAACTQLIQTAARLEWDAGVWHSEIYAKFQ